MLYNTLGVTTTVVHIYSDESWNIIEDIYNLCRFHFSKMLSTISDMSFHVWWESNSARKKQPSWKEHVQSLFPFGHFRNTWGPTGSRFSFSNGLRYYEEINVGGNTSVGGKRGMTELLSIYTAGKLYGEAGGGDLQDQHLLSFKTDTPSGSTAVILSRKGNFFFNFKYIFSLTSNIFDL